MRQTWRWWALVGLILLFGAGLRWHDLGHTPPGLYHDEAYYALDALDVIQGRWALYFPANNGREPLFIYLVAASVSVFGRTPFAVRLPAALVGVLLLPATYALGRALFNRRVGLLGMALAAFTFWPLALSRVGFRASTLPFLTALSLACVIWGWRRQRLPWAILGGALYGLTFYTYLAARLTPLPLTVFGVFWYSFRRLTFPPTRWLVAFGVPAALVVAPFGWLLFTQPALFAERAEQVSILNPAINHGDLWGTFFYNLWATVGMFFWHGDPIARHNLPGRPVFDGLMALWFGLGVVWAGWRVVTQRALAPTLLGLWVAALLTPTLFAEDTPHFLRAVGTLPWVLLFPALALNALWDWPRLRRWAPTIASLSVLFTGVMTTTAYFRSYAQSDAARYLFESAARQLAEDINAAQAAGENVYADERFATQFASVRFLLPQAEAVHWFPTRGALPPLPATTAPWRVFLWPYEDSRVTLASLPVGWLITPRSGPLHRGDLETTTYPLYAEYVAEPNCRVCGTPEATFANGVQLEAVFLNPTSNGWDMQLVWSTNAAPGRVWQVFAQALDVEGTVLTQADGPLGTPLYPSDRWRAGEHVRETREFEAASLTAVSFSVGLYDPLTNERVIRTDAVFDSVLVLAPQPAPP